VLAFFHVVFVLVELVITFYFLYNIFFKYLQNTTKKSEMSLVFVKIVKILIIF